MHSPEKTVNWGGRYVEKKYENCDLDKVFRTAVMHSRASLYLMMGHRRASTS